jgi:hypothetical protein
MEAKTLADRDVAAHMWQWLRLVVTESSVRKKHLKLSRRASHDNVSLQSYVSDGQRMPAGEFASIPLCRHEELVRREDRLRKMAKQKSTPKKRA